MKLKLLGYKLQLTALSKFKFNEQTLKKLTDEDLKKFSNLKIENFKKNLYTTDILTNLETYKFFPQKRVRNRFSAASAPFPPTTPTFGTAKRSSPCAR